MRHRLSQPNAFSLVEITLALGVAAVALVSVLGLLGVAANSNRTAGRDTVAVSMTQQVLADLRAAEFDALWLAEPRNADGAPKLATPATGANPPAPEPSLFYFTADGTRVPAAEAAKNPETTYLCTVRKVPDPATRTANNGPFNLLRFELVFISPPTANADASLQRQVIHASLARY